MDTVRNAPVTCRFQGRKLLFSLFSGVPNAASAVVKLASQMRANNQISQLLCCLTTGFLP